MFKRRQYFKVACLLIFTVFLLGACGHGDLNNPYPEADDGKNILYQVFSERPKHLDPVQSYSTNEIQFTAQIYEPPLQYHYLKRPFTLIPLTADRMPEIKSFDKDGRLVTSDASADIIAYTVYEISIKPGILYQPHPAFARNPKGDFLYHNVTDEMLTDTYQLSDFSEVGTRELTAADYVYQIKRLAHPDLHSPIYGLMVDYIAGLKELADRLRIAAQEGGKEGYLDLNQYELEGIEVIDTYTYRIRVIGQYPQFIYWLAMPFFSPIPWEADKFYAQQALIEKNITLDWYPVGTGPYMLTQNNPNLVMVLEKNPNFHGELYPVEGMPEDRDKGLLNDAGKALPFVERVVFTREKENIPIWNKFLQGYYDFSGIGSDSFDQAVQLAGGSEARITDAMAAQGIRLEAAVALSTYYVGFNMLDPIVGGGGSEQSQKSARKLRQAISIAVDYEEYISIFANGSGIPAQGPISPGIAGYREGRAGMNTVVYDWIDGKPVRKSIEVAKRLLADAGYPDGIDHKTGAPLVLYFDVTARSAEDRSELDWMRKQFQKLNIQLVVRNTDYNRFQDKIRKGNAQIFEWGWNADYPDPENFLFLLYGPQQKVSYQGENAANYRNREYDELFNKMKNMPNGSERQEIIDRMVNILRQDAPWIWGHHPKIYGLYHAWYQNIKPNRIAQNNLKYLRINENLRERMRQEWNEPVFWPIILVLIVLGIGLIPAIFSFRRRERRLGVS